MIDFLKKYKLALLCSFLILIVSFFVTYVFVPINCDDIWSYGFSYNISKGLIIYRDFSIVTAPLYYFIGSLFVKLFGNYIISLSIFNALLFAGIFFMMFLVLKWKAFIIIPLIMVFYPNGYSLLCLFWLMLILILIEKGKDNDILIGFIVGLIFITKQNIGICLFIPYIFYAKNKIKSIMTFVIPFLFVSVYMLMNDAFCSFIDCCFLGLFDFGSNNLLITVFALIEFIIIICLVFFIISNKFRNKELFYILMFQILSYPIFEPSHCFACYIPILYYILNRPVRNHYLILVAWAIYLLNFLVFFSVCNIPNLHDDILFLKNSGTASNAMMELHEYLDDVDNYYFMDYFGYLYKLYHYIPITQYDFWNDGNLGYHGVERRISEVDKICSKEKCDFLIFKNESAPQCEKIYEYIIENYNFKENVGVFAVYSNE